MRLDTEKTMTRTRLQSQFTGTCIVVIDSTSGKDDFIRHKDADNTSDLPRRGLAAITIRVTFWLQNICFVFAKQVTKTQHY